MSKFDAQFYSRFRPLYPPGLYATWGAHLVQSGLQPPYRLLDVGCGTGHSILSAHQGGVRGDWTALDPDPEMLDYARGLLRSDLERVDFVNAPAEVLPLEDGRFDGLQVASAFHWMRSEEAASEFLRVLKAGGLLALYEYQFPKCRELPVLNEWIRREFNLRWKAPQQKPRGSFKEVTSVFRRSSRFQLLEESPHPMVLSLRAEDLLGLLLSQSRVLHFENQLSAPEVAEFRKTLFAHLDSEMNGKAGEFDFALSYVLFRKLA